MVRLELLLNFQLKKSSIDPGKKNIVISILKQTVKSRCAPKIAYKIDIFLVFTGSWKKEEGEKQQLKP